MSDDKIEQDVARLIPELRCPECNLEVSRPKCLFDMGAACPRHPSATVWRATIRAVTAWARGLVAERDERIAAWKKAIEGLTPNGSGFVNDPGACAAYIRKTYSPVETFKALRQENERLKRVITAIMGRCAELLDDDHFNNLEALVDTEPTFDAVTEDLRQRLADVERERDKYKLDSECDEHALIEVIEALDGEPVVGEKTGPKSRVHLGTAERVKQLQAERDAAHVAGMREAMEIVRRNKDFKGYLHEIVADEIADAIKAREDKE